MTVIGFPLFPDLLQLDLTGPYGVLAAGPNVRIHLLWKDLNPIRSSDGLILLPTTTFEDCPPLDALCVPGGVGVLPLLGDDTVLSFLRHQAATCRFVTSVCTGALVLGAAGLLKGYRATTHWQSLDLLPLLGAVPERRRVVLDRNRLTAAGVSSGVDMALRLAGLLWGDRVAEEIQLGMEYAPEPPYRAGTPETAPPEAVAKAQAEAAERQRLRRIAVTEAARRLMDESPGCVLPS